MQSGSSCKNKVLYSVRGKDLWIHSLIIGALSWIATWDVRGWWLAIIIMATHFVVDWLKTCIQLKGNILEIDETRKKVIDGANKRNDLWVFVGDQILHFLLIVVCANVWLGINNDWTQIEWLHDLAVNHPLRVKAAVAMLFALKPANILILNILGACKVNITPKGNDDHGNFHSGELIGWLERGLMLLFVVMSQYEAIGFLVAAKSILRFNEASKGDEKSEYVLTGTLLSLAVALVLGILVLKT